jgi:hypothetical protein
MNRLIGVVVGLVVLLAAGPTIVAVIHALIPLIAVAAVAGMLARAVWFYTR